MFRAHRFQVTGLIEGQWYAYRVRAFNKLGASRPCRATDEIQAVERTFVIPSMFKEVYEKIEVNFSCVHL